MTKGMEGIAKKGMHEVALPRKKDSPQRGAKKKSRQGAKSLNKVLNPMLLPGTVLGVGGAVLGAGGEMLSAGTSTALGTMGTVVGNLASGSILTSQALMTVPGTVLKTLGAPILRKTPLMRDLKTGIRDRYEGTEASIADVFREMDTGGKGSLDAKALGAALTKMNVSGVNGDAALQEMDADGDGQVSLAEFEEWMDEALDAGDVIEEPDVSRLGCCARGVSP
jgi:hypothetical protein